MIRLAGTASGGASSQSMEPPPSLPYLSPSSIKSYLACPLKYYFEKVVLLKRPTSPSLHLGKAVHEALRRHHLSLWRGEGLTCEQIVKAYRESFAALEAEEPVSFKDEAQREASLAAGERVVRAYLEHESVSFLTERPAGVEVRLEESVPGLPVPLYGIIDLVRPGNIPVDFKTAASAPSDLELESFLHEIQTTAYCLMLEEATGMAVTGVELVWLVKTKTPKIIRRVMPPPSHEQRRRFLSLANFVRDGIGAERFHPQPGPQCSWCPFRSECSKWTGGET